MEILWRDKHSCFLLIPRMFYYLLQQNCFERYVSILVVYFFSFFFKASEKKLVNWIRFQALQGTKLDLSQVTKENSINFCLFTSLYHLFISSLCIMSPPDLIMRRDFWKNGSRYLFKSLSSLWIKRITYSVNVEIMIMVKL